MKDSETASRRDYWDRIRNWDKEAREEEMGSYRIHPDGDTEWYDKGGDIISHPTHYTSHPSGVEPIEISKYETFLRGNVIKYVMRAPYKNNELEDLKKARQYLDWEIDRIERERDSSGA